MSSQPKYGEPPKNVFGCWDCGGPSGGAYLADGFMNFMSLLFIATLAIIALFFLYKRYLVGRSSEDGKEDLEK